RVSGDNRASEPPRLTSPRTVLIASVVLLLFQYALIGQGLTGQVSGRIQDPSAEVIPDADVTLTSNVTGQVRKAKTNTAGEFVFPQVLPGSFNLRVESAGFKTFEQTHAALSSGEHLVLNPITLELGQVSDTVLVEANLAPIETQSSDR